VIHRDLKPSNIVLAADEQPYLVDFGIARVMEEAGTLTTTQVILGTPAYLSPEQAAGRKDVGPAADVWGLGMILYEVLTGRLPFAGDTAYATLLAIQRQPITPPRRIDRKVPRSLERICLRCLRKKSQERYASAAQLAADLERVSQGKALGWTWGERSGLRGLVGLVVGAFLLAALLLVANRWGYIDRAYLAHHQEDVTRLERCLNHFDYEGMVTTIDAMPSWARESLLAPRLRRRYEDIRRCLRYTIRAALPVRQRTHVPSGDEALEVLLERSLCSWRWSKDSRRLVGRLSWPPEDSNVWANLGVQLPRIQNPVPGELPGSHRVLDARTGRPLDEPIPRTVAPAEKNLLDHRALRDRADARLRLCFGEAPTIRPYVRIVVMPSPDGRLLLTGAAARRGWWSGAFIAREVDQIRSEMNLLLQLLGPEKAAEVREGRAPLWCWNVWDLSKMPQ
jgi:hypothetical protein